MTQVLTLQQMFDKVVTHLRKQGERAMNGAVCAYRGVGNTQCAVGCLIPDEIYDPKMEGRGVYGLCDDFPAVRALLPTVAHQTLALDLQSVHDSFAAQSWESALKRIAKLHHLKMPAKSDALSIRVSPKRLREVFAEANMFGPNGYYFTSPENQTLFQAQLIKARVSRAAREWAGSKTARAKRGTPASARTGCAGCSTR